MSKLAKYKNFIIFFWSEDLSERPHVHISKNRKQKRPAKFWIEPEVKLFDDGDFTENEIFDVERILIKYIDNLKDRIERYRKGERLKPLIIRK